MVEEIIQNLPTYMLVGIIVVVGVSQINRLIGAGLGIVFWGATAYVGSVAYETGGELGVGSLRFGQTAFYALCITFMLFNVLLGYVAIKRKRQIPAYDDD